MCNVKTGYYSWYLWEIMCKLKMKPPYRRHDLCSYVSFSPVQPHYLMLNLSFFCICPSGRGQAGSEEGSQGRSQRDTHEGAGEATKGGNDFKCFLTLAGVQPCCTIKWISWLLVLCGQLGPTTFPVNFPFALQGALFCGSRVTGCRPRAAAPA